jgi:aryl-alcohol dehydrogenase-like predicted oxidoreductase
MKHLSLAGLDVTRLGLGLMGMSAAYTGAATDDAESLRTIHRALDLGVTFFDTSESYGPYTNERLAAKALAGRWDQVVIATKFGYYSHRDGNPEPTERNIDSHPDNVRLALEGSLKRLGTDHVDLLYQHRVDPKTPIEDTIGAMAELVQQGKVRHIGMSEAAVDTVRRAHAVHPITALQYEYSLFTREPAEAILALSRELGIGFVSYSPLGRGILTGKVRDRKAMEPTDFRFANPRYADENLAHNLALVDEVAAIGRETGATSAQVAIAWVLAQGDDIATIPGTKAVSRLEENVVADGLVLTKDQLSRLDRLQPAAGDRYIGINAEQAGL